MTARSYERAKRAADVALAGAVGIVAAPVMLAIAAAIKLDDGGRILFRQERVGRYGQPFEIVKFRTLADAPAHDPADYLISAGGPPKNPGGGVEDARGRARDAPTRERG